MPESALFPSGLVLGFVGGYTVPSPGPGFWSVGNESVLGCDPIPFVSTTFSSTNSIAEVVAWNTGTMEASVVSVDNDTVVFSGVGPGNVGFYELQDTALTWDVGRRFALQLTPSSGVDNSWCFLIQYADNAGFSA